MNLTYQQTPKQALSF